MTDFSRNQITSIRLKNHSVDRWVIPNDRQLSLRAKLGIGWSVRTNRSNSYAYHDDHAHNLTEQEMRHIMRVVERASSHERLEKDRVGYLVNHYERLKERCRGDGVANCFLCGTEFQKFRSQLIMCTDCHNGVCSECSVDTVNSNRERMMVCKICSERRELWKKSGAWFFGEIPPHSDLTGSQLLNFRSDSRAIRPLTPEPADLGRSASDQCFLRQSSPLLPRVVHTSPMMDRSEPTGVTTVSTFRGRGSSSSDNSDDDDDNISSSSGISFDKHRASNRFLKAGDDVDNLSGNPLLTPTRKMSAASVNSGHHIDDQISATESSQDLRLLSLKPNIQEDVAAMIVRTQDVNTIPAGKVQKSPGVSFDADVISNSSEGFAMSSMKAASGNLSMARCVSIPNAEDDDTSYLDDDDDDDDQDSPYGSISFTIFYHEQSQQLDIDLVGSKHLPEKLQPYNTYVVMNLVPSPGNSRKQRTSTQYATPSPKWKQKLSYHGISMDELLIKSLVFSVYDENIISADELVGEFKLPLRQLRSYKLTYYHVYLEKKIILAADELIAGEDRGKVMLSIRYNSNASQLHVAVIRCAALHVPNTDAFANPYVKLYLQPDYSKTSKKKTEVVKKTLNPEFHEEFTYKIERKSLEKKTLEITVWDHSVMRNTFLGGVCLSLASPSPSEKTHWSHVLHQPDRRHDFWHSLRDTLTK